VAVVREFCKEEVAMSQTKRMADEANRIGQQAQERFQTGFEAASRSFGEANRGFQVLASEMTDFSKRRFEDVFRAWEQRVALTAVVSQNPIPTTQVKEMMSELSTLK